MNPYNDDSDDEEIEYEDQGFYEDRDTLSRGRQALGLSVNYVPSWKPPHAVREIYQNWKDGIIEAFRLHQKNFEVIVKGFDAKDVYITEARHPESKMLLGFIRFQNGVLEFTNFKAQLPRRALDLGVTTKRDNHELAGTHGEGFKVAALVMARRGYRVRYEASEYYWNFKLGGRNKNHLYCHLGPMAEGKLGSLKKADATRLSKGTPRPLTSNIWEDVSVKIGRFNAKSGGEKIAKDDFLRWVNVSLDLDNPAKMIQTPYGSLILDEKFKGRIYLKGLLLEGNTSSKDFRFGYNFLRGDVNRDRQRLTDSKSEADMLTKIWTAAIDKDGLEILDQYITMLKESTLADVNLAQDYISEPLAKKIWQRLLAQDPEKKIFYHDNINSDRDVELIRWSLRKEPFQLPRCIWDTMRKYKLARTAQEQRYHLLYNAPVSTTQETPYSASVKRALRASLALDSRTKKLGMIFKNGQKAELDLLLHQTDLLIHERWLDFDASHQAAPCWLSRLALRNKMQIDTFSCDHIIVGLYELVLAEIKKGPGEETVDEVEKDSSLRLKVSESLRQMPRKIKMVQGSKGGEIEVSWTDMESDMASRMHGLNVECRVTLHRESICAQKRNFLLALTNPGDVLENDQTEQPTQTSQPPVKCGCPEQVVPQKDSRAVFQNLSDTETYFPLVSRTDDQAFYGVPPCALRPKAPEAELLIPSRAFAPTLRARPAPCEPSNTKHDSHVPASFNEDYGNIYDAESDDENVMDPDSSVEHQSSQSSVSDADSDTIRVDSRIGSEPKSSTAHTSAKKNQSASKRPLVEQPKDIEKAEDEINKLRRDVKTSEESLVKIREELRMLTAHTVHVQLKLAQEINAGADKDKQIKDRIAASQRLEQELAVVNQYLGALKEKFSPLANEIQQLNVQLSTKEQELQSAAALTRRQNFQLVSKDQELQAANAMIQSHRERLTHLVTSLNTRSEERNAAESRAEVLKAAKEIADATIGQLNLKIERLLEENFTLSETLQEAERDLSEQRRIFSRQEERLKSYNGGVKRPWSGLDRGDGSSLAGSVKKPRHGSMSLPDGPIDLTEDA